MAAEKPVSVADQIRRLLGHLGIEQAHFAGRLPTDWAELAAAAPEVFCSLTLVGPMAVDVPAANRLGSRLMVLNGDHGQIADRLRGVMTQLPQARLVALAGCNALGWTDVVAEHATPIGDAMIDFLAPAEANSGVKAVAGVKPEGEVDGITYRVRGKGAPLILLPLFLAPSQWEPLVARLSERYCTITLGGAALGAVAILESRGRSPGYQRMLGTLVDEAQLRPGESVLEVGSGTGVIARWLAHRTGKKNRIVGVDINNYLLGEAQALVDRDGLQSSVEFRQGNAEELPFPDNSFDVTISVTVIEEVDADRLLAEMRRVTRPGGRVAVICRSVDTAFIRNVTLGPALKAKVDAPGGNVSEKGCADASLYARFIQAGLTAVKKFPQLAVFDQTDTTALQFMEDNFLPRLAPSEVKEWRAARASAEAAGTFFMAWPHHCAVGTKA